MVPNVNLVVDWTHVFVEWTRATVIKLNDQTSISHSISMVHEKRSIKRGDCVPLKGNGDKATETKLFEQVKFQNILSLLKAKNVEVQVHGM